MRCKGVAVRKDLYNHDRRRRIDDYLSNRLFDVVIPKRTKHVVNAQASVFKFDEWFDTIREKFSTPRGAEEVRLYLVGQNLVTQVTPPFPILRHLSTMSYVLFLTNILPF